MQTLAPDPSGQSSVYAGAYRPVLFDLRNGNWEKVADGTGSAFPSLNAVAVDPQRPRTIYAAVSSAILPPPYPFGATGGIYRSADGGQTWFFKEVHQNDPLTSVTVDPLNEGTVYALASVCSCTTTPFYCFRLGQSCSASAYKSTDSGTKWTRLRALDGLADFAIDPIVPFTLFAISGGEVFESPDGGSTWAPIKSGFGACVVGTKLTVAPSDPSTLYVTANSSCPAVVYRTTDGGSTWKPTAPIPTLAGLPDSLAVDPTDERVVYAAALGKSGGVFRSTDGGLSWSRFDEGLPRQGVRLVGAGRDGAVHVSLYTVGVFDYSYDPPLRSRIRAIPRPPITTSIPPR